MAWTRIICGGVLLFALALSSHGATFVPLGNLPGSYFDSSAYGISADGSVIVGRSELVLDAAFLWDSTHGMRKLSSVLTTNYEIDLSGWYLQSATGISADGTRIIGFGLHNGATEAFYVDLIAVPEPAAVSMAVTAMAGLCGVAMRRRMSFLSRPTSWASRLRGRSRRVAPGARPPVG